MSQRGGLEAEPDSAAGDLRRSRRRRAFAGVVLVGSITAVAEVLPLGFALYGGVLLVAWTQDRWDATWNDGDAWIAAAAALIAVLIAIGSGAVVRGVARGGGLAPRVTVLVVTGVSLAAAPVPALPIMRS